MVRMRYNLRCCKCGFVIVKFVDTEVSHCPKCGNEYPKSDLEFKESEEC